MPRMDELRIRSLVDRVEQHPDRLLKHLRELQEAAMWCMDRVLELGGSDSDADEKARMTALQLEVRELLRQARSP